MRYSEEAIQAIVDSYQKRAKRLEENISDLGGDSKTTLFIPSNGNQDILYDDSRINIDHFDIKYFRSYLIDFRIFMNCSDKIIINNRIKDKRKDQDNPKKFFEDILYIMQDKYPNNNSLATFQERWDKLQNNYQFSIKDKDKPKMFFEEVLDIMKEKYPNDNSLAVFQERWDKLQNSYQLSIIGIKNLSKQDFIHLFLQSIFHEDDEKLKMLKDIDLNAPLYLDAFRFEVENMVYHCILPLSKFIAANYATSTKKDCLG